MSYQESLKSLRRETRDNTIKALLDFSMCLGLRFFLSPEKVALPQVQYLLSVFCVSFLIPAVLHIQWASDAQHARHLLKMEEYARQSLELDQQFQKIFQTTIPGAK